MEGSGDVDSALLAGLSGGRGAAFPVSFPGSGVVWARPGHTLLFSVPRCIALVLCALVFPFLQTLKATQVGVMMVMGRLVLAYCLHQALGLWSPLCCGAPLPFIFGGHPRGPGRT